MKSHKINTELIWGEETCNKNKEEGEIFERAENARVGSRNLLIAIFMHGARYAKNREVHLNYKKALELLYENY